MNKKIVLLAMMAIGQTIYSAPVTTYGYMENLVQTISRSGTLDQYCTDFNYKIPNSQIAEIAKAEIVEYIKTLIAIIKDVEDLQSFNTRISDINNIITMKFNLNAPQFEKDLKPMIITVFLNTILNINNNNKYTFESSDINSVETANNALKSAYNHLTTFPFVMAINLNNHFIKECKNIIFFGKNLFTTTTEKFATTQEEIRKNFNKSAFQYITALQYLLKIGEYDDIKMSIKECLNELNKYFTKTTDTKYKDEMALRISTLEKEYDRAIKSKLDFMNSQVNRIQELAQMDGSIEDAKFTNTKIQKLNNNDKIEDIQTKIEGIKSEMSIEVAKRDSYFTTEKNRILDWAKSGSVSKLFHATSSSIRSSVKDLIGNNEESTLKEYATYDIEKIKTMSFETFVKNNYQWPLKNTANTSAETKTGVVDSTLNGAVSALEFNAALEGIKNMKLEDDDTTPISFTKQLRSKRQYNYDNDTDTQTPLRKKLKPTNKRTQRDDYEYENDEDDDDDDYYESNNYRQLLQMKQALAMNKLIEQSGGMQSVLKAQLQGKLFGTVMDKIDNFGTSSKPRTKRSRSRNRRYQD